MILYVDGCSHSVGEEANGIIPYGKIIAKDLSVSLNSKAMNGKSNDAIFSDTLEFIEQTLRVPSFDKFAFIQFSAPNRRVHQLVDGSKIFVNPYDNTDYHLNLEPMASRNTLNYIVSLQKILKSYNINFSMMCYFPLEYSIVNKKFADRMIDYSKFITFDKNKHPIFDGFIDGMKESNMISDSVGHPSQLGHQFLVDKIIKRMMFRKKQINLI